MKTKRTFAILLAASSSAIATPSGLNNIPTAETTPQGTFVLQTYSTVGENRDSDFALGFKTGIDLRAVKLELGCDSHLVPGKGGPVTFNGKAAVPLGEGLPILAIGAANNTFDTQDRNRAGDTFAYFVATQDFKWLQFTAGIGVQDSQPLPFFGVAKTFRITTKQPMAAEKSTGHGSGKSVVKEEVVTRDLFTLRSDAIQQTNHDWLLSAGLLVPVCKHFVFEGWANFPTDGTEVSFTLKGNFVFKF